MIWFKFFTFLIGENALDLSTPAKIVYDLYYNKENVKYFFIHKKISKLISLFIRYGLRGEDVLYGEDISALTFRTVLYCRYVLVDFDKKIFFIKASDKICHT